jgi:hypothetical protein
MEEVMKKSVTVIGACVAVCLGIVLSSSAVADRVGSAKQHVQKSAIVPNVVGVPGTATELAELLAAQGVTVSNAVLTGAATAAGSFSEGQDSIGIDSGVVLSSGAVADVAGPNTNPGTTTAHGTPGDTDLDALTGGLSTHDAVILEFDFVPTTSNMAFSYVFTSEEYNEYVNSEYNDVFAFFVNGVNCALVEGDPVSVNTINNGNPFGTEPNSHPQLYINNETGALDTEMDGLTVVLTCNAAVDNGQTNHIKLAIADTSDELLDSAVFIQAGSIGAPPTPASPYGVPALSIGGLLVLISGLLALGFGSLRRRL